MSTNPLLDAWEAADLGRPDPQLRSRRELVNKTDSTQGGNRETRFEYRLVVENFGNERNPCRMISF